MSIRNLTKKQGKFKINNPGNHKIGNGVLHVNWRWFPIFTGIIIGLVFPIATDWIMFNDPFPCSTVEKFEDGSSLQKCEVRR
jgi:hypothetical protein